MYITCKSSGSTLCWLRNTNHVNSAWVLGYNASHWSFVKSCDFHGALILKLKTSMVLSSAVFVFFCMGRNHMDQDHYTLGGQYSHGNVSNHPSGATVRWIILLPMDALQLRTLLLWDLCNLFYCDQMLEMCPGMRTTSSSKWLTKLVASFVAFCSQWTIQKCIVSAAMLVLSPICTSSNNNQMIWHLLVPCKCRGQHPHGDWLG